jgi:hypothetical protein
MTVDKTTFCTQPVNIFTIHPYTKFYTSSPSSRLVCAIQPKVKLKFSHSCKVVLHGTKLTSRKVAYFFKEPLPQCFIYLHWVVTVSHPPYKTVCLPCFHYWLYQSYKYMAGVASIGINIVTVSYFNSWKDGVPIYSICTANYMCCAVPMLNTPSFKWGMCLSTPPFPIFQ